MLASKDAIYFDRTEKMAYDSLFPLSSLVRTAVHFPVSMHLRRGQMHRPGPLQCAPARTRLLNGSDALVYNARRIKLWGI